MNALNTIPAASAAETAAVFATATAVSAAAEAPAPEAAPYTPFAEFLRRVSLLPAEPRTVRNYALSLRGRAVNDRMDRYRVHRGESAAQLREALISPRHYLIARNEPAESRTGERFELAQFCRQAILDPAKFGRVVVRPRYNRGTLAGNAELVKFYWETLRMPQDTDLSVLNIKGLRDKVDELEELARLAGYTFIDSAHADIVRMIRASYANYGGGILPRMMRYARTGTSFYGTDPATGLRVKVRPDAVLLAENWGLNAVVSVRTTRAATVGAFWADCAAYGCALTEAMRMQVAGEVAGRTFSAAVTVMVQTVYPYQVAVFYWDAADLEAGRRDYARALKIVSRSRAANFWPGFDGLSDAGAWGILPGKLPEAARCPVLPAGLQTA